MRPPSVTSSPSLLPPGVPLTQPIKVKERTRAVVRMTSLHPGGDLQEQDVVVVDDRAADTVLGLDLHDVRVVELRLEIVARVVVGEPSSQVPQRLVRLAGVVDGDRV